MTILTIRDLFRLLKRRFIIVLLCPLLSLIIGFVTIQYGIPSTYQSTSTLFVYEDPSGTNMMNKDTSMFVKDARSYLLNSTEIRKLIDKQSSSYSPSQLKSVIKVSAVVYEPDLIQISVTTTNRQRSQALCHQVAELLSTRVMGFPGAYSGVVMNDASEATSVYHPKKIYYALLLAFGFMIAVALILKTDRPFGTNENLHVPSPETLRREGQI